MMRSVFVRRGAAVALLLLGGACTASNPTTPSGNVPAATVTNYIEASSAVVGTASIAGTFQASGTPAVSGGPAATATGPSSVSNNGGGLYRVTSQTAFSRVYVSVTTSNAQVPGYWQIDLPAAATSQQIGLSYAAPVPAAVFDLRFQVATPAGAVGPVVALPTSVVSPGASFAPEIVMSAVPSPAPFRNGANCTLQSRKGCLWEFTITIREFMGIGVDPVMLNETYTFTGETPTTSTFTTSIPPRGTTTIVRTIACDDTNINCATPGMLAGGTYSFTLTGTDALGGEFARPGLTVTLQAR